VKLGAPMRRDGRDPQAIISISILPENAVPCLLVP
jgi:hypothetical protein